MIYDTLENLNQYTGLFQNLDTLIDWMEEYDCHTLPEGYTAIDGDKVFVTVETAALKESARPFMAHSSHMTLVVDLEGSEIAEVSMAELTEHTPYNEGSDTTLYDAPMTGAVVLSPDRFALFMAEEPYHTGCKTQHSATVRRAVFKVLYD